MVPKVVEGDCRVVGGWKEGRPWACSVQTPLQKEADPGDSRGHCAQVLDS